MALEKRNKTSHTYHEDVAEEIFFKLEDFIPIIEKILILFEGKNVPQILY